MTLQDKVALLAWNERYVSAPEDGGRVYCLSENAGECEMLQVSCSDCLISLSFVSDPDLALALVVSRRGTGCNLSRVRHFEADL